MYNNNILRVPHGINVEVKEKKVEKECYLLLIKG
jgi:hypothetical protein